MRWFRNNLTANHVFAFLALLAVFTVLTFVITNAGVDNDPNHSKRVVQATAGTITGPLTGANARGFQDCCLECSLWLMAWCAPVLAIGVISQFLGSSKQKLVGTIRMGLWTAGWLAWFLGGIISFGHALN